MASNSPDAYFQTHPGAVMFDDSGEFGTTTVFESRAEAERVGRRVAARFGFRFLRVRAEGGGWSPIWALANREREEGQSAPLE